MKQLPLNLDAAELDKFSALADSWWDPGGSSKALHDINPFRLEYICSHAAVEGARVLDVGCGGGLLSEALATVGARVTGIDASADLTQVADLHRQISGLSIEYHTTTAEVFALDHNGSFDTVTCMELLEHVPDPGALIGACCTLLKPTGHLIVSTINRTSRSYLLAILGAEYLLRVLPRGTHNFDRFIRPSELEQYCRQGGGRLVDLTGMSYNPLLHTAHRTASMAVNYLACVEKS